MEFNQKEEDSTIMITAEQIKKKIRVLPFIPCISGFILLISLVITPTVPMFILRKPFTVDDAGVGMIMPWRIVGESSYLCAHYLTAVPNPEKEGEVILNQKKVYNECGYAFTDEEMEFMPKMRNLLPVKGADKNGFDGTNNYNRFRITGGDASFNPNTYNATTVESTEESESRRSLLQEEEVEYENHALDSVFRHVDRTINFIVPSELQFGWILLLLADSLYLTLIMCWYYVDHKKMEGISKQKVLKWEKGVQFCSMLGCLLMIGSIFIVSIYEDSFNNKLFSFWIPGPSYYVFAVCALFGIINFVLVKTVRLVPERVTARKLQLAEAQADAAAEMAAATI